MKKSHIAALVIIAASIMYIISISGNYSTYANFDKAAANPNKVFQVVGYLNKDKPLHYEPQVDPNYFSFFMEDKAGEEQKVVYLGAKPADFERSEDIVLTGSMKKDAFHASKILLKCPSKYNDGSNGPGEVEFQANK